MTQALFEVQTFDGDGWITRHRGTDIDAAGEAAKRALPGAKKFAVRIVKQSYDAEHSQLVNQVVFSLGKPRRRTFRKIAGTAAALAMSAAAIAAAMVVTEIEPEALVALVDRSPALEATADEVAAAPVQTALTSLNPAAGAAGEILPTRTATGFDCEREAANGLVRATNISPDRDELYTLCGQALRGDAPAQVALAGKLAAGDGTAEDSSQAVHWLQLAARAGYAEAYRPLADLLMGAANDPARAVAWYHRAATGGDADAAMMLAQRYRDGDGVDRDARIALSYALMAAEAGDSAAMRFAAEAFGNGVGADANPEAARRWLVRAAEADDGEAIAGLASQDVAQPISWAIPLGADAEASEVQPATWTAPGVDATPVAQLLSVPSLHLDFDQDAQEHYSTFALGAVQASV